jgi:hypothetical protein
LVGAVTSIEVLTTNRGDSFECAKRRIASLIGDASYGFYHADDVMRARHRYVHSGIEPDDPRVVADATALAFCCILRFVSIACNFPSKDAVLAYLDLIAAASRMEGVWTPAETRLFGDARTHEPELLRFAFFRRESPDGQ